MSKPSSADTHRFHHGGQLRTAAALFGTPDAGWLDLSTGINPNGWPVPPLPSSAWARLPEEEDDLENVARRYYRAESLLPVPGSLAAIRLLPRLRSRSRVGIVEPTFAEHAAAWKRAGHEVIALESKPETAELCRLEVVVVTNPDNPTGTLYSPAWLLDLHRELAAKNGWLVVDEAFMDCSPEKSIASFANRPGLIVFRSLGKFFGLAGARVGFTCAAPALLSRMREQLGPWAVAGPARWVAIAALEDRPWHLQARKWLTKAESRLGALLSRYGMPPDGGCPLFQWLQIPEADTLFDGLARRGILIRCFSHPRSVRFGLPGKESEWERLEEALAEVAPLVKEHLS